MAGIRPVPRRPAGRSPWSYRPGNTLLHRAPPVVKLLCLLVITTLGLIFPFRGIIAGAALVLAGAAAARIRPPELLRGSTSVFVMVIAVVLLRTVRLFPPALDGAGLVEALNFGLTVLLSFAAGSLLFSVTTMAELREGLAPLLGVRFSLALSLMLGFLPRFFEAWKESLDAWKARGGKPGPRALFTLLPLVSSRMITLAGETACALESRGAGRF